MLNNINNQSRETIYGINSLNNSSNLEYFKKRHEYKNLIDKIQKSNKGAIITIYSHPEKYEYKYDNLQNIKDTMGYSSFEMNVLRDFLYTLNNYNLTKKNIKELTNFLAKKGKKSEKINLDFAFFDDTNNSMNKLLLKSSKNECNTAIKKRNIAIDFICKKYLKEKIRLDIINNLKQQMSNENNESKKENFYNQIEIVRKIGKVKHNLSLPSGFISNSINKNKEIYNKYSKNINNEVNRLLKEYKNENKNENKIENKNTINKNNKIIQKGGEPITIVILSIIVSVITLYFKFLIFVSLFTYVLSIIPCYDQVTKGEMLELLIKKIMFDLFVTFLVTFTFGILLPNTILKFTKNIYEIFEKIFHKTSNIILTKAFFGKKLEKSEEKTNEHIISNKTEEHIIDTVLSAKPQKTSISSKMLKILKKIAKFLIIDESICRGKITSSNIEYKSHNLKQEFNHSLNPVFSDYLYEVRCVGIISTYGLYGRFKHYEFVIIDLASNKLIGKILIDKDFANKYYDVDGNSLKNISKSLNDETKQKEKLNNVLNNVEDENKEYIKLFFLFLTALFNKKYEKKINGKSSMFKSLFSFFGKKEKQK